jgi:hypothetical protein
VTPTESPVPVVEATAVPKSTSASSPTPRDIRRDATAITVVDDVRIRSKPRISDDSFKHEPLLPRGTPLYVLDGPVSASGYAWYEVAPLASRSLPRGWVASASRDGEPWLAARDFACPSIPTKLSALAALPTGAGLACFPRVPITVRARLIGCNCDMDGAWYTPHWFFLGSGGPKLLVEPDVTRPPDDTGNWFILSLDPAGEHPDVLPVDQVVEVTGIFDHPAAAKCTMTEMDGEPVATQDCRLVFAVTKLLVLGP